MEKRLTLKFVSAFIVTLVSINSFAQNITTPRTPSPAASVSQTIGISTVTVRYSRPSIKGRTVWGELVPYGWNVQQFGTANLAPWRAGANENTVIEFSHPAKVEGQSVPAGTYGLFLVVNKDDSGEVILSKDYKSWGNFFYTPDHDLMRAKIQLRSGPQTEMLTYDFVNDTKNSAELVLSWEKKQFPVKIEFAVDDIVLANADLELKGAMGFNFPAYNGAANYALQNNLLDKAMSYIEQSMAHNGKTAFNTFNIKANILRKMGKDAEADKVMEEAMPVANEQDINLYGYSFLTKKEFDKGIAILAMNTTRYPKSANAWDSLGEGYALKGDKKNAIINFRKSLALNPPEATKANSEKYLKELGAMK